MSALNTVSGDVGTVRTEMCDGSRIDPEAAALELLVEEVAFEAQLEPAEPSGHVGSVAVEANAPRRIEALIHGISDEDHAPAWGEHGNTTVEQEPRVVAVVERLEEDHCVNGFARVVIEKGTVSHFERYLEARRGCEATRRILC